MSPSTLISDEEFQSFCSNRLNRLQLSCCICETGGWATNDLFKNIKNMMIPTCNDDQHAICYSCIIKLPESQNRCLFPYSSCFGNLDLCNYKIDRGYFTKCSNCSKFSRNLDPEGVCFCQFCERKSCGRCDEIDCNCFNIEQQDLVKGYSRFFSEKNQDGEYFPIRRNFISNEMFEQKIRDMKQDFPWFHSVCPTCEISIYKSSACNDMHHCGNARTCNFCLHRSFPWEDGICADHWKICPKWDYEIKDFLCRDGLCINDGQECSLESHKRGISELHELRLEYSLKRLKNDIRSNILN
jgi:hypothetical protein